jgi:Holliday junction resolvase RusA-like endonuclease
LEIKKKKTSLGKVFKFTVMGRPVAAPRMTQRDKWMKRKCVVNYRSWKERARESAGDIPDPKLIKSLSWTAYFCPPESWSKKKKESVIGQLHRSRPDRDNIDKAVLDSLFSEDSAIASGFIEKRWDWVERVEITIELL